MLGDAVNKANDESLKPQLENKTPLNAQMKGTWKSTNNAEKTLTISPIGISLNDGKITTDLKMAGINCQGEVCEFNNGMTEYGSLANEIKNPGGKAYVEGDQLTISGSDF